MNIAVPIIAGTTVKGLVATLMMRKVLERHPNAFLITLSQFGVTIPLHKSQEHIAHDMQKGLIQKGYQPDDPVILVGHSQGALAALRYATDHPQQVKHVISVGAPWNGSISAANISSIIRKTGFDIAPALTDMSTGSTFLTKLHNELPTIADRVTNIYSTHEIFISPYINAHIDIPKVKNILISTENEYARHLTTYPTYPVDDIIFDQVTHIGEMNSEKVRSIIWRTVQEAHTTITLQNQ